MNAPVTPREWELLSAYLDGQLTEQDRRKVDELLAQDPQWRANLSSLRRTRAVLRAAPRRRAPHNFTLSPAQARQARPRWTWGWAPSLGFASALATVLFVLSFFFRLAPGGSVMLSAPAAAPAPMAAQERTAQDGNPPIIVWGDSSPPGAGGGTGMGGGMAEANPKLQAAGTPAAPPDQPTLAAPQATAAPAQAVAPSLDASRPASVAATPTAGTTSKSASQPQSTAAAPSQNGPILGVAPTEERGKMLAPTRAARDMAENSAPAGLDWNWVRVGLAGLALASGMAAWIVFRRTRR